MSNYITIKNDSSLSDGIGFIHTWIEIENPGYDPTYFSFSNSTNTSLGGHDAVGEMTNQQMEDRISTTQIRIKITNQQYSDLIKNIEAFQKNIPNYDIFPDNEGDFNCTTAVGYVLAQSDIHYLDGLQNPFAVSNRINNTEKIPFTDDMDPTKTPSSDPIISLETVLDFKDQYDDLRSFLDDKTRERLDLIAQYDPALKLILETGDVIEHDLSDFEDYLLENLVDPAPSQLMQFYKDYLEYKKD